MAKFVTFDTSLIDAVIIFPDSFSHLDMIFKMCAEPISAGFVSLSDQGELYTYGRSVSLGIGTKVTDIDLIKKMLDDIKTC